MQPRGGTEILVENLLSQLGTEVFNQINLLISNTNPQALDPSKPNILWQHLDIDQRNAQGLRDPKFVSQLSEVVYVSHWQKTQFQNWFEISGGQVIRNAIQPIDFVAKPTGKLQLIYTSMPYRGLSVLLDSFEKLANPDVELTIYSSNIIYGRNWQSSDPVETERLFHRCRTMPGVHYRGYGTNKAVRRALQNSHILAYPSIFRETSCMSAIEAGAAGCRIITTDLGALPETCAGWARMVPYNSDHQTLVACYTDALREEIEHFQLNSYNSQRQSQWFNTQYSWETRKNEWQLLLKAHLAGL